MMQQLLIGLTLRSLTEPAKVARWLLEQKFSREVLALAFALVVVLNAVAFSMAVLIEDGPVPSILARPSTFAILQAASVAATILALLWAGRLLGGRARLEDIAVLVIWMQALRVLVQAGFVLLAPFGGGGSNFLASLSSVIGFWILLNFLNEAHGFGSLAKSLFTIVLGLLGMAFALSILLTLMGVDPTGINGYV